MRNLSLSSRLLIVVFAALLTGCFSDPTAIKQFRLGSSKDAIGDLECRANEEEPRADVCVGSKGQQNLTIAKTPVRVPRLEFIDEQLAYADFEFEGIMTLDNFETVKAAVIRKYGAPDKESRENEAEMTVATSSWDRMNGDHMWLHFEVSEQQPAGHMTLVINSKKYSDFVFARISKQMRERDPVSVDVLNDI